MNDVDSCPRCAGRAVFKLEKCGGSHKVGYYQCEKCALKLSEVMATNTVADEKLREFAAVGWKRRAEDWVSSHE